jgi:hypothetical protein
MTENDPCFGYKITSEASPVKEKIALEFEKRKNDLFKAWKEKRAAISSEARGGNPAATGRDHRLRPGPIS